MLHSAMEIRPGGQKSYILKINEIIWFYNRFLNLYGEYDAARNKYFLRRGVYYDLFKACKFDNPVDALFYLSHEV